MKSFNFKTTAFIFAASLAMLSCDKETILQDSEIPTAIKSYVTENFPENPIIQAVKDRDGITTTYDIILDQNITLEFNSDKEIIDIDGAIALPNSVIPEKIAQYVSTNHPANTITNWEMDDRRQKVKLNNGLELEFNKDSDFLRIDD